MNCNTTHYRANSSSVPGDPTASAVHAVAIADGSRTATNARVFASRLRAIRRITFTTELSATFRVGAYDIAVSVDVLAEGDELVFRYVRSRSDFYSLLAQAIAELAEATPNARPSLADAVFRLLLAETDTEIETYLARRGVVWHPNARRERDTSADEDDDEDTKRAQLAEALAAELLKRGREKGKRGGSGAGKPPDSKPGDKSKSRPPLKLPPLSKVALSDAPDIDWHPNPRRSGGGGGGGGGWTPRSPQEQAEDLVLATRAEELIYRDECERVRALGLDASRVEWTSRTNPSADHDIKSINERGGDLWIEVKATRGRDGHFDWPRSEFELALGAREDYVLCRVYEAHTRKPSLRRIQDPVSKLASNEIRLDVSNVGAEVAPLGRD